MIAAVVIVRCPGCDQQLQAPVTVAGIEAVDGALRVVRFSAAHVDHRCEDLP